MDLSWSDADLRFREEVRAFLDAELTPELRHVGKTLTSVGNGTHGDHQSHKM